MSIEFENKTIVITGATSGIGFAAASELARQRAYVIATGRTPERCREAEERIRNHNPSARIVFLAADLSSQDEVARLARDIEETLRKDGRNSIDVLINNAGVFTSWFESTKEGIEAQFAVNHLAPFLLTHLLMPLLKASPEARVITMSSGSHYKTRMNWKDIQLRKRYNCLRAYKQSKLCNVLFSLELKKRAHDANIAVFACDPGLVNTEMGLKNTSGIAYRVWSIRRHQGVAPDVAAKSLAWLAAETSIQKSNQIYWKYCRPKKPSRYSMNEEAARRLWHISEKMCGINSEDYGLGAAFYADEESVHTDPEKRGIQARNDI